MSETIRLGLIASGYGLAGVFTVLILFYITTKIMLWLFKTKDTNDQN